MATSRSFAKLFTGAGIALALMATATLGTEPASGAAVTTGTTSATTNPSNPLAGRHWGVYKGRADMSWSPYADSTGADRTLLGKISLRPKAQWFGKWISNATIAQKVDDYIANSTGGNPDTLVQMTIFRMQPWEHDTCKRLPTTAERKSYKQWTVRAANAIGDAHVALILQPDGPFALCAPNHSNIYSRLVAYAARKYSAQPNTSVYIDAGASDWPSKDPKKAADILVPGGIQYARGFAVNATHYATTADEINAGTALVHELNSRGLRGKHFVINTSSNGKGFTFSHAPGSNPDNADVCATAMSNTCVTLGIPPTTNVASTKWGFDSLTRERAEKYVDGYLWFGRPWLKNQASPYVMSRALQLARTTPY